MSNTRSQFDDKSVSEETDLSSFKKLVKSKSVNQKKGLITEMAESQISNMENSSSKRKYSIDEIYQQLGNIITTINSYIIDTKHIKVVKDFNKQLKTVIKDIKNTKNYITKYDKQQQKTQKKKRVVNNSGFQKPVKISKELAKFLGWDKDTMYPRVDVTKFLCKYIKDNNLQDSSDRRNIIVTRDKKLQKLLNYNETVPLTYYRLQTYLKPHYIKN